MKRFQFAVPFAVTTCMCLFSTNAAMIHGQVVQLPSTRSLSYSGSVWVPDGGTASLGGGSASSFGSRSSGWGPSANRAAGSSISGSSISATVQIIDLAALDEAILEGFGPAKPTEPNATTAISPVVSTDPNEASSNTGLREDVSRPTMQHATYLTEKVSERVDADPGKWQRVLSGGGDLSERNPSLLESDIRFYVEHGEAAESAGRLMAARVYYKMARDLMTPDLIERYERVVTQRQQAEEARLKSELEAVRRRF